MAMIQTLGDYLSTQQGIASASISTHTTGAAIDRLGYDHALLVQNTTNFSGTPTFVIKLQHSTTSNTTGFSDFTPNYVYNNNTNYTTAAMPSVSTNGVSKTDVDLQAAYRYIRVVTVISGTTSAVQGVTVLLGQREGVVPGSTA